ncbi:hypothetical protein [Nonomuraea wenchangensis]|uniref:Uncharacterized protein n=1 Tax=Nonomuraea wenchangensis TaxID=568860 RepID=A0A1I0LVJ3_9ACTN|nr:hypothetical protein [Nonomuraea wenchangensis]SEU47848.1 hypothetical protein SAMN05421811_13223 [Nonomuraea wenchangensis]
MCLSDLPYPASRPAPSDHPASPPSSGSPPLSSVQAIEAIYQRLLSDQGHWGAGTLQAISDVLVRAGRGIEAEMMETVTGWPIARVHTDQVEGYIMQATDGGVVVDLYTRDEQAADRLHVLVDGRPVCGRPLPEAMQAERRPQPA